MKLLWWIIALVILAAVFFLAGWLYTGRPEYLQAGTFIMLILTLVALVTYAYDTHTIASVSRADAEQRTPVRLATYLMGTADREHPGLRERTMFEVHNPTTMLVRAKIWCNFRVYGEPVEYHKDFNGDNVWVVFPQQVSRGYFELSPLLAKKGKTCQQMTDERTQANWLDQLTMDLEIEYQDELGHSRRLPRRRSYFDFGEWRWVPFLTSSADEEWQE